jgi:predicted phosphatase
MATFTGSFGSLLWAAALVCVGVLVGVYAAVKWYRYNLVRHPDKIALLSKEARELQALRDEKLAAALPPGVVRYLAEVRSDVDELRRRLNTIDDIKAAVDKLAGK